MDADKEGSKAQPLPDQEVSVDDQLITNETGAEIAIKSVKGPRKKNVKGEQFISDATIRTGSPKAGKRQDGELEQKGMKKKPVKEKDSSDSPNTIKGKGTGIKTVQQKVKKNSLVGSPTTKAPSRSKSKGSGPTGSKRKALDDTEDAAASTKSVKRSKSKSTDSPNSSRSKGARSKVVKDKEAIETEDGAPIAESPAVVESKDGCLSSADLGRESVIPEVSVTGKSRKKVDKKQEIQDPMSSPSSMDQDHNYHASTGMHIPDDLLPEVAKPQRRKNCLDNKTGNKTPIRSPRGTGKQWKASPKQVTIPASKDFSENEKCSSSSATASLSETLIQKTSDIEQVQHGSQSDNPKTKKSRSQSRRKSAMPEEPHEGKDIKIGISTDAVVYKPVISTHVLAEDEANSKVEVNPDNFYTKQTGRSGTKAGRKSSTKRDIVDTHPDPAAEDAVESNAAVDIEGDNACTVPGELVKLEVKEAVLSSPQVRGRSRKASPALSAEADAHETVRQEPSEDPILSPTSSQLRPTNGKVQAKTDKTESLPMEEQTKPVPTKEPVTRPRKGRRKAQGITENSDIDVDVKVGLTSAEEVDNKLIKCVNTEESNLSKYVDCDVDAAVAKEAESITPRSRGRTRKTSAIPVSNSDTVMETKESVPQGISAGRSRRGSAKGRELKGDVPSESEIESHTKKGPGRPRKTSALPEDSNATKPVIAELETKLISVKRAGSRRGSNASSSTKASQAEEIAGMSMETIGVAASPQPDDLPVETESNDNPVDKVDNVEEKTDLDSSGSSQSLIDIFKHTIALRQQLAKERHKWQKPDDEMSTTSSVDGSVKGVDRKNVFEVFSCPESGAESEGVLSGAEHSAGDNLQKKAVIRRASTIMKSQQEKMDSQSDSELERVSAPQRRPPSRRSSGLSALEDSASAKTDSLLDEKSATRSSSRRSSVARSVEEFDKDQVDTLCQDDSTEDVPNAPLKRGPGRPPRPKLPDTQDQSNIKEPESSAPVKKGRSERQCNINTSNDQQKDSPQEDEIGKNRDFGRNGQDEKFESSANLDNDQADVHKNDEKAMIEHEHSCHDEIPLNDKQSTPTDICIDVTDKVKDLQHSDSGITCDEPASTASVEVASPDVMDVKVEDSVSAPVDQTTADNSASDNLPAGNTPDHQDKTKSMDAQTLEGQDNSTANGKNLFILTQFVCCHPSSSVVNYFIRILTNSSYKLNFYRS